MSDRQFGGFHGGLPSRPDELAAHARTFDLAALVFLLRELGYSDEAIELRSNQTTLHQGTVVAHLEIVKSPQSRAIITVNLGFLATQSPLPTYFQKVLDGGQGASLSAFLNFFAHRLLRADVAGMFPERDPRLFADFARTKQQLRSLLGVRSLSTTHWAFQSFYPELEVAVRRTILDRPIRTHGMILGDWALGDGSVCGSVATAPVSAIGVTLFCDDATTYSGEPWARAAEHRLRRDVFPCLRSHGLFLEVALVFRDQSSFLILAPQQFLGYEPIYPGDTPIDPQTRTSRTVILWRGEVPASAGAAELATGAPPALREHKAPPGSAPR